MEALLAPIPAIHVVDGGDVFAEYGRVAYGSNALDLFEKLRQEGSDAGLPVLIYASATGSESIAKQIDLHKIVCTAKLDGFDLCDRRGKHMRSHLRPKRAQAGDGPFALFWEIVDLKRLERPAKLSSVRTLQSGGKKGGVLTNAPQGPIRVWIEDAMLSNNF